MTFRPGSLRQHKRLLPGEPSDRQRASVKRRHLARRWCGPWVLPQVRARQRQLARQWRQLQLPPQERVRHRQQVLELQTVSARHRVREQRAPVRQDRAQRQGKVRHRRLAWYLRQASVLRLVVVRHPVFRAWRHSAMRQATVPQTVSAHPLPARQPQRAATVQHPVSGFRRHRQPPAQRERARQVVSALQLHRRPPARQDRAQQAAQAR